MRKILQAQKRCHEKEGHVSKRLRKEGDRTMKGEPLQILLVEDNEDHAELVRRSFQSHQVANNIHHVADGEVALDYLLRRGAYRDTEDKSQT